ncbi:MAG: XRE family transcriptional regulator [Alphaproteobacteria bacterium]|nr:MAG: XRE family transcriptional regulator [Alphaproteobacteria bacterium]
MRTFNTVATLIKNKRIEHPQSYSQSELANLLGHKCDKLIVSIENAECNVPLKIMPKLANVLDIHPDDFVEAVMKDHEKNLNNYFSKTFKDQIVYM